MFRLRLEWNHFVLNRFSTFELRESAERCHFTVEIHAAQRIQLAREGDGDRVVDEIVTGNTASVQRQQVPVKAADDGDQVYGILHGVGVGSGFLDGIILAIGDSCPAHRFLRGKVS
jgi:hypothetical protein